MACGLHLGIGCAHRLASMRPRRRSRRLRGRRLRRFAGEQSGSLSHRPRSSLLRGPKHSCTERLSLLLRQDSFELIPSRSNNFQSVRRPQGVSLEHLPDQAGFLVGLNVLESVQDLPHDLQVRRPLADGAPALKPRDGTHPAIGEHFFGKEFSARFDRDLLSLK